MDNISLSQIIERIPILKYRYIGNYPADNVPNLPKYTFAIINTAPSSSSGEHWIMIARLNKTYYFADSLGRRRYKFLNKKYQRMVPRKLQNIENLCGFYTIYAAFHLFTFFESKINNVHDCHVLNFISNFM